MKMTLPALFLALALAARAEDPIRPDPKLTPGAVMTNVTVEQIMEKGYANKLNGGVRHVTAAEKKLIFTEYFGKVPGDEGPLRDRPFNQPGTGRQQRSQEPVASKLLYRALECEGERQAGGQDGCEREA